MSNDNTRTAIIVAAWVIVLGIVIVGPGLRDWIGSDCQGAKVTVGQVDGGATVGPDTRAHMTGAGHKGLE